MQAISHRHREQKAAALTPADDVIPVTPEDPNHYTNPTTRIADAQAYWASSIATRMPMNTDSARTSHSWVTHLTEDGVDRRFIQEAVGHRCDTSTAIYTHVSGDFMNTALRRALAPALGQQD